MSHCKADEDEWRADEHRKAADKSVGLLGSATKAASRFSAKERASKTRQDGYNAKAKAGPMWSESE